MTKTTIKITKNSVGSGRIATNDTWVSNGHWAVIRALIKNNSDKELEALATKLNYDKKLGELTDNSERVLQDVLDGLSVKNAKNAWKFSGVIVARDVASGGTGKGLGDALVYRRLMSSPDVELAFFAREYIEFLQVRDQVDMLTLHGKGPEDPFADAHGQVILMPVTYRDGEVRDAALFGLSALASDKLPGSGEAARTRKRKRTSTRKRATIK